MFLPHVCYYFDIFQATISDDGETMVAVGQHHLFLDRVLHTVSSPLMLKVSEAFMAVVHIMLFSLWTGKHGAGGASETHKRGHHANICVGPEWFCFYFLGTVLPASYSARLQAKHVRKMASSIFMYIWDVQHQI